MDGLHPSRDRQRRLRTRPGRHGFQHDYCCLRGLVSIRICSVPLAKKKKNVQRPDDAARRIEAVFLREQSGLCQSAPHQEFFQPHGVISKAREVEAKERSRQGGTHKTSMMSVVTPRSGKIRDRATPHNHPTPPTWRTELKQSWIPGSNAPVKLCAFTMGRAVPQVQYIRKSLVPDVCPGCLVRHSRSPGLLSSTPFTCFGGTP